jgi:hypothetical protein
MKSDRELIALSKSNTLRVIADKLLRPPEAILRKAAKLGISIERGGAAEVTNRSAD